MRAVGVRRTAQSAAPIRGACAAGSRRPPGPDNGWWRPAGHEDIAEWVSAHYTAVHIGNVAVYDLTAPACADAPGITCAK
jgi:hypothetical protein